MTDAARLERFSAGEHFAVHPDAIERELSSLWRAAGKSSDAAHPVTRACLWNVAIHVEERAGREGYFDPEAQVRMVNDLPRYLAARAVVLRTREPEADKEELESWISANCILSGDGGKLVCSEEITLASRGPGDRHLPSLVRALLVPAVPTALVFGGVPDPEAPMIKGLVGAADRLVVRADRAQGSDPLRRIAKYLERPDLSVIDLGWVDSSAWRREVAALVDPPFPAEEISRIQKAELRAAPSERVTARLLLGWIGASLGVGLPVRIGHGAWRLPKVGGGDLQLNLRIDEGEALGVELSGHNLSRPLAIAARRDTETIDISTVEGFVDQKPIKQRQAAAILSRALVTRGHDRAFQRALRLATELS
jgi:glucose-6-phosphate dehydrogenase assembly protein OpcA